jgi:hypothetical protein
MYFQQKGGDEMDRGIEAIMKAQLKHKITKLSDNQAQIALLAILEGKELQEAIEIAETNK